MSWIQWPYVDPQPAGIGVAELPRAEARERQPWDAASSLPTGSLVLWVVIVTVTMLFAGFLSAYLIRRTSGDWMPIYSPPLLLVNTAVIIASSAALEIARARRATAFTFWMLIAAGLGVAFIAGQVQVWRQLAAAGIFLPSSPHGSFFYMLSSVHAFHLLGGIVALLAVLHKSVRRGIGASAVATRMAATYWHFVTGIWIVLYVLLFVWD